MILTLAIDNCLDSYAYRSYSTTLLDIIDTHLILDYLTSGSILMRDEPFLIATSLTEILMLATHIVLAGVAMLQLIDIEGSLLLSCCVEYCRMQ